MPLQRAGLKDSNLSFKFTSLIRDEVAVATFKPDKEKAVLK